MRVDGTRLALARLALSPLGCSHVPAARPDRLLHAFGKISGLHGSSLVHGHYSP